MFFYKKSLGQNFLQKDSVTKRVADLTDIKGSNVLEIGPGAGALTKHLVEASNLILIEKDDRLIKKLEDKFSKATIINGDFLEFDLSTLKEKYKLIACIPYNITGPIIEKVLLNKNLFIEIILVVQKELAERAVAKSGANRSLFSVFVQLFSEASLEFIIPRNAFFPVPKVDSAALKLKVNDRPIDLSLLKTIKILFANKRKQIVNNLAREFDREKVIDILNSLQISGKKRAEELSLEEFISINNRLRQT